MLSQEGQKEKNLHGGEKKPVGAKTLNQRRRGIKEDSDQKKKTGNS